MRAFVMLWACIAGGCAVPPSAVQPMMLTSATPLTVAVDASTTMGRHSHQVESHAVIQHGASVGSVGIWSGGGLVAAHATTNKQATAHRWFGAMPFITGGLRLHGCHVSVALSGGAGATPAFTISGGVLEGTAGCQTGTIQFAVRGLVHSYHDGGSATHGNSATALLTYQPRWSLAPNFTLALARRHASFENIPVGDHGRPGGATDSFTDVDRGWSVIVAAGVAFASTLK